jgi:spore coat polysaccharide biosynthesis protein SpsF
MIWCFIQARMSSERLPGKVMRKWTRGKLIIDEIIDTAEAIMPGRTVVLTSNLSSDDPLAFYLKKRGVPCLRGELENVLKRFKGAADAFCEKKDIVVRLCADSPLLDADLLTCFVEQLDEFNDFYSTRVMTSDRNFISHTCKGQNIDAVRVDALHGIKEIGDAIEHIVPGFNFVSKFKLISYDISGDFAIDTPEDYERLRP